MYFDDSGRPWRGNQCPSCYRKYQTIKNREAGHKPRDLITERKNKKARDAEILAAAYFRNNGFQVDLTSGMGPDLILKKNDLTLTCEVKSTTESKYHPNCFIVAKISPNRMEDDIVAIVLPSGVVHVEPMKSHLSKCQKHGARSVTKLIRRRRWVGAEECSPEDKKIATDRAKLASTKHGRYSKK